MKIRIAHRTVRFLRMSLVAAVGGAVLGALAVATPASADSYAPINGAGSTWSQIAVDAWRADVRTNGLVVNFAGTGASSTSSTHRTSRSRRSRSRILPSPVSRRRFPIARTRTCRSWQVARRLCIT